MVVAPGVAVVLLLGELSGGKELEVETKEGEEGWGPVMVVSRAVAGEAVAGEVVAVVESVVAFGEV